MGFLDSYFQTSPQAQSEGWLSALMRKIGEQAAAESGMSPAELAGASAGWGGQAPSAPMQRGEPPFGVGAMPGIGFGSQAFQTPQFASAAPAPSPPQMAPPLPVPREISLPPNSTPAAGIPPPGAQAAPYFPPPAAAPVPAPAPAAPQPSIFDRIMAGLGNNSNALLAFGGGTLSGGIGHGLTAMAQAGSLDRAARQEAQQNAAVQATYDALLKAGHSPAEALAGAQNPKVLETLMTKPQLQRYGTDANGQPLFGIVNPSSGSVTIPKVMGGDQTPAVDPNLTGPQYLESLPTGRRNIIEGMLDGRIAPLTMGRAGSPIVSGYLQDAARADPGFDYTKWTTRNKTAMDFASAGKSGMALKNAEQGLSHVEELMKSVEALPDTGSPMLNAVKNKTQMALMGNPPYRDVMTNAHAVADEFSKMWKGGSNSDAEIRSWEANLSPDMTHKEWQGQIRKLMGLLGGSLSAFESSRDRGMATTRELPPLLNEKSRAIMDRASAWGSGREPPAQSAAAPASMPAPKAGQWIDLGGGVRVREIP